MAKTLRATIFDLLSDPEVALRSLRASAREGGGAFSLGGGVERRGEFETNHVEWMARACGELAPPVKCSVKVNDLGVRVTPFLFIPRALLREHYSEEDLRRLRVDMAEEFEGAYEGKSVVYKRRKVSFERFKHNAALAEDLASTPLLFYFLTFLKFGVFGSRGTLFFERLTRIAEHLQARGGAGAAAFLRSWLESHHFFWSLQRQHVHGYVQDRKLQTWRQYPPCFDGCLYSLKLLHTRSITFKGQRLDAVQCFRGKRWAGVRFALDALSRKPGPVSCPRELLDGVWLLDASPHRPLRRCLVAGDPDLVPGCPWLSRAMPFVKAAGLPPPPPGRADRQGAYREVAVFLALCGALHDRGEARDASSAVWKEIYEAAAEGRDTGVLRERLLRWRPHLAYAAAAVAAAGAAREHERAPEGLCRSIARSYQESSAGAAEPHYVLQSEFVRRSLALDHTAEHTAPLAERTALAKWLAARNGEPVMVLVLPQGGHLTALDMAFTQRLGLPQLCPSFCEGAFFLRCWREVHVYVTAGFSDALAACAELVGGKCAGARARAFDHLFTLEGGPFDAFLLWCVSQTTGREDPGFCDRWRSEKGGPGGARGSAGEAVYGAPPAKEAKSSAARMLFFKHPAAKLSAAHGHPLACGLGDLLETLAAVDVREGGGAPRV